MGYQSFFPGALGAFCRTPEHSIAVNLCDDTFRNFHSKGIVCYIPLEKGEWWVVEDATDKGTDSLSAALHKGSVSRRPAAMF